MWWFSVEMRNMVDTLQEVGATDFLTLAKATGMVDSLERNLTIFVPTNEALQDFSAAMDIEVVMMMMIMMILIVYTCTLLIYL